MLEAGASSYDKVVDNDMKEILGAGSFHKTIVQEWLINHPQWNDSTASVLIGSTGRLVSVSTYLGQ